VGRAATLLCALLVLLLAGCGGDDDEGGDGGETAPPAQTTQEAPQADGGMPPTEEALRSCLSDAGLELKPGSVEFTDAEGESKPREGLDIADTTYLGYVDWPSKHVADVYLSEDEAAAEKAEREAGLFVKAFGADPADYVRRAGSVVMISDDPPATEEEAKPVEDCAAG
jgi:hypothetical protein